MKIKFSLVCTLMVTAVLNEMSGPPLPGASPQARTVCEIYSSGKNLENVIGTVDALEPAELDSHRSGSRLGVPDPEDHGGVTRRLDPHQSGITPDVNGSTRDQAMLIILEVSTRRIDVAVIQPVTL